VLPTVTTQSGFSYVPDKGGTLQKINNKTGAAVWSINAADLFGPGAIIRTAPAICTGTVVVGGWSADASMPSTASVVGLSADTGKVQWHTLIESDPGARLFQSPIIYRGTIYIGVGGLAAEIASAGGTSVPTFRGSVVALSLASGKQLWKTYTVPKVAGYNGGAVWGNTLALDEKTNLLFVGTGNNYTLPPDVAACINGMGGGDVGTLCEPLNFGNNPDSLMALDATNGAVKWAKRVRSWDAYGCGHNCTAPAGGPDYDFAAGPQLFVTPSGRQLVGAGHKSGAFIALERSSGNVAWIKNIGPGSSLGGIERECAVDGTRVYCPHSNWTQSSVALIDGSITTAGYWTAMDAETGAVLWQQANPSGAKALSPVTITPTGVLFGCSMDPSGLCYAFNAATGAVLWQAATGASNGGGVSVVGGRVYVGTGYNALGDLVNMGTDGSQMQIYAVPGAPPDPITPVHSSGEGRGGDGGKDN
jgi:polyvinyl alcohol dehydrogenase (cytochrome)